MKETTQPPKDPKKKLWIGYAVILAIVILSNIFLFPAVMQASVKSVNYSTFLQMLESKELATVQIEDQQIYFVDKNDNSYKTNAIAQDNNLVTRLEDAGVEFGTVYQSPTIWDSLLNLLISFLPMIILFWFVNRWASKKMQEMGGAGGNAMLFGGKSGAKQYVVDDETGIKFNDVAGEDEAKESLQEIVDFLHNPKKYEEIGAKMPKGVLLVGPPGTGKTLLARAVAGEAGVPFFSIAGSEFVEMFVGMGASKVRDLFKQAGEKAPCIVFIDEIDTIGKKRDGGSNLGGNDEREQTLNQLLTEMDGFDATKGVVILAATNRPESLDPALTRPGRFDRRVPVELPDLKGRESILRLHAKKVKLGPDCDFGVVARMTPGASGAELANIVNEAALCAVRHHRKAVTQFDLQEAVDTILAGAQKKNKILNNKEKCIVSYHEVGHALVAALQTNSAPVQKITIVPRTSGALGFTMQVEDGDHTLMTKEEILNKIATLTGGRAAEELIFHSITTGASNDIEQATKLARALVTRYGMTEDFDMVALETVNNAYLGGDASLACSEQTAAQVDAKVVEIVQAEHKKAYKLLADNKRKLDEIAQYLYEKETISGEEFMRILNAQPQLPAGPSADSTNQAQ
ncbi:MAG: ATP-dependent zinc metalloprotease FtsH [Gemmiger formicilis]|uniref:ATP-dependent zinc metalloprotease FtsH n=1 Tax=Gemmiger formicilis TaxID=745368 RepID=UPI0022E24532|nr:ATP-dependent zinc metalloprotease FtsH [Gemmiger formicilis]MDD5841757.1 ATP-dependent zinc metalloprotease FtsH [Gemmiger formicilis]MDD6391942.1 ATP-dependent zinc metalloprotease FtsH [Gemmiger formicilis]MDD6426089.1 ATP-dependent zinc metalloprotease FtsH [Gemmiger formicilis]MDD6523172.1 ATP-dependent zinc metalloprotease FtsH [Gemmiger formicilis]MDD6573470.1 ATP-dependent zinc metalloprotease FtsH [Gemmiger formicilis]